MKKFLCAAVVFALACASSFSEVIFSGGFEVPMVSSTIYFVDDDLSGLDGTRIRGFGFGGEAQLRYVHSSSIAMMVGADLSRVSLDVVEEHKFWSGNTASIYLGLGMNFSEELDDFRCIGSVIAGVDGIVLERKTVLGSGNLNLGEFDSSYSYGNLMIGLDLVFIQDIVKHLGFYFGCSASVGIGVGDFSVKSVASDFKREYGFGSQIFVFKPRLGLCLIL